MKDAFPLVIIGVSLIAIVVAVVASLASGGLYERIGRGGLSMDRDDMTRPGPAPGSPAAKAEADEEIRQLVIARNERRLRQGKEPVDVEAEVERQLRDLGG
jgi:hypothetical protein